MEIFEGRVSFGFSSNEDGNLGLRFDKKKVVNRRREKFFEHEEVDPCLSVAMIPEHKNRIVRVAKEDSGRGIKDLDSAYSSDVLITQDKELNLILPVADCIPLVLYDANNETLAMVHVGVKNLAGDTVSKSIDAMSRIAEGGELHVVTGPFIKKCCYSFDKIPEHLRVLESYFKKENDLYFLDTETALRDQLLASGVKEKNIDISELCSRHDDFPSHRRSLEKNLPESRMLVYARMVV